MEILVRLYRTRHLNFGILTTAAATRKSFPLVSTGHKLLICTLTNVCMYKRIVGDRKMNRSLASSFQAVQHIHMGWRMPTYRTYMYSYIVFVPIWANKRRLSMLLQLQLSHTWLFVSIYLCTNSSHMNAEMCTFLFHFIIKLTNFRKCREKSFVFFLSKLVTYCSKALRFSRSARWELTLYFIYSDSWILQFSWICQLNGHFSVIFWHYRWKFKIDQWFSFVLRF